MRGSVTVDHRAVPTRGGEPSPGLKGGEPPCGRRSVRGPVVLRGEHPRGDVDDRRSAAGDEGERDEQDAQQGGVGAQARGEPAADPASIRSVRLRRSVKRGAGAGGSAAWGASVMRWCRRGWCRWGCRCSPWHRACRRAPAPTSGRPRTPTPTRPRPVSGSRAGDRPAAAIGCAADQVWSAATAAARARSRRAARGGQHLDGVADIHSTRSAWRRSPNSTRLAGGRAGRGAPRRSQRSRSEIATVRHRHPGGHRPAWAASPRTPPGGAAKPPPGPLPTRGAPGRPTPPRRRPGRSGRCAPRRPGSPAGTTGRPPRRGRPGRPCATARARPARRTAAAAAYPRRPRDGPPPGARPVRGRPATRPAG